jgi:hypothetical protein
MFKASLKRQGSVQLAKVAALAVVVGATLGWNPVATAATHRLDTPRSAELREVRFQGDELEALFWLCDHAATTRTIEVNERATCGAVAEQLKTEKFGGDFEQMLNWWRKNKVAQHQKLDRDAAPNAAQ